MVRFVCTYVMYIRVHLTPLSFLVVSLKNSIFLFSFYFVYVFYIRPPSLGSSYSFIIIQKTPVYRVFQLLRFDGPHRFGSINIILHRTKKLQICPTSSNAFIFHFKAFTSFLDYRDNPLLYKKGAFDAS